MKRQHSPLMLGIVAMTVFSLAAKCDSRKTGSGNDDQQHPVVSSVALPSPKPVPSVAAPAREELFYGEGDCAPRFANGMRGTCINNKPCNGFGVKDKRGTLTCECFGVKGGCAEGTVCSVIKRACVPPKDAER